VLVYFSSLVHTRSNTPWLFHPLEQPYDRANSEFSATVVNAYYNPMTNTINFPAGILQAPIFDTMPAMFQYARMGSVVGHEVVHAFDSSGRFWGAFGQYGDWMDANSSSNFNEQARCIIDQFDDYYLVIKGQRVHVNGLQTLGENIADLGGVKATFNAYRAWVAANEEEFPDKSLIPQLTNDQLFWVLYGQTWCAAQSDDILAYLLASDEHAPNRFRVNGPLSNLDQFVSSFNCPAGSNMNRKEKCLVW